MVDLGREGFRMMHSKKALVGVALAMAAGIGGVGSLAATEPGPPTDNDG